MTVTDKSEVVEDDGGLPDGPRYLRNYKEHKAGDRRRCPKCHRVLVWPPTVETPTVTRASLDSSNSAGINSHCQSCKSIRRSKRRAADLDAARARERSWYAKNAEAIRLRRRALYASNLERERARARGYERDGRAVRARRTTGALEADRRRLRPDAVKQCRKCHEQLTLDKFYSDRTSRDGLSTKCRACFDSGIRPLAVAYWLLMDQPDWALQRCYLCHCPLDSSWHVEHVIPLSIGGIGVEGNLLPACAPCNLSKHTRNVADVLLERHPYAHPGDPAIEHIRQLAEAADDPRALVRAIEQLDPEALQPADPAVD